MDWLLEDVTEDNLESESDSEETQKELEARLYAIVHHNDLSHPLDPELAKHYSVHQAGDGEVVVTLKNSLEDLKTEETKTFLNQSERTSAEDDVIIVSNENPVETIKQKQNPYKRFRYSDINLDKPDDSKISGNFQSSNPDLKDLLNTYKHCKYGDGSLDRGHESNVKAGTEFKLKGINYFKIGPYFFEQNPKFINLKVPKFYTDRPKPNLAKSDQNWKTSSNSSFLSFESITPDKIIQRMTHALVELNPGVYKDKLTKFAKLLYKRNVKSYKNKEKAKKRRKTSKLNGLRTETDNSFNWSQEEFNSLDDSKVNNSFMDHNKKIPTLLKNAANDRLNGSITLNLSPFIPDPPLVDLVSDEERNTSVISVNSTPSSSKEQSNAHIPGKWSKSMIKFYTKTSKRKKEMDLNEIFNSFKNTSDKDWHLDPRDLLGRYQSPTVKLSTRRRCPNCNQRGHMTRDCPKPKKILTCSLCGEYYHSDYSCPNIVCLKCGEPSTQGECSACYYHTFEYDVACSICGKANHRTSYCTDLWRSFHATTEGEKKIPEKRTVNKRKYCCNCARRGHFSDACPFLTHGVQQVSAFVTNYSGDATDTGTTEITLPQDYLNIIFNDDADRFLQHLSDSTKAVITLDDDVCKVNGTFQQCKLVQTEIESYVNNKKRKRQEPQMRKKKRRLR